MAEQSSNNQVTGIFTSLLTVAFIVLKLCKVIDWSWWWVLSPLWIPILILIVIGIIWLIYKILHSRKKHREFEEWRQRMRDGK